MTYQQTYQEWLDHLDENDPLRKQLVDIKDDEVEKEDRFYKDLSFGTAGLRD